MCFILGLNYKVLLIGGLEDHLFLIGRSKLFLATRSCGLKKMHSLGLKAWSNKSILQIDAWSQVEKYLLPPFVKYKQNCNMFLLYPSIAQCKTLQGFCMVVPFFNLSLCVFTCLIKCLTINTSNSKWNMNLFSHKCCKFIMWLKGHIMLPLVPLP